MSKTFIGLDTCRISKKERAKINTIVACLECRDMFFLTDEPQPGDLVVCPYCHQKRELRPEEKEHPILKDWLQNFMKKRGVK